MINVSNFHLLLITLSIQTYLEEGRTAEGNKLLIIAIKTLDYYYTNIITALEGWIFSVGFEGV